MKATKVQATGKSCAAVMMDCERISSKQEQEARQAHRPSQAALVALQAKINGQYHKQ